MLTKPYWRFAFIEGKNIEYWDLSKDKLDSNSDLFECWYLNEIELTKNNVVFAESHSTGVAKKDFVTVIGEVILDWDHKEMYGVPLLERSDYKQLIFEHLAKIAVGLRKENAKGRNRERDLKSEVNVCTLTQKQLQK